MAEFLNGQLVTKLILKNPIEQKPVLYALKNFGIEIEISEKNTLEEFMAVN